MIVNTNRFTDPKEKPPAKHPNSLRNYLFDLTKTEGDRFYDKAKGGDSKYYDALSKVSDIGLIAKKYNDTWETDEPEWLLPKDAPGVSELKGIYDGLGDDKKIELLNLLKFEDGNIQTESKFKMLNKLGLVNSLKALKHFKTVNNYAEDNDLIYEDGGKMKVPVKKFKLDPNAPKAFMGAALGFASKFGDQIGEGMSGMGAGAEALGSINDRTDAGMQQQLIQSQQGGESPLSKMLEGKRKRKAGYDIAKASAGSVPIIGGLLKGGMDLVKGAASLFGGPEDEFGVRKGQYKRNDALARSRDTFFKGKENALIDKMDVMGAQNAFNTPSFQAPMFGKCGMKLTRFR
jgi:hypothetical protein